MTAHALDPSEVHSLVTPRESIQLHYDQSNEFFRLALGPTLTYSCALWTDPNQSLDEAQYAKLDYHLDNTRARGVQRLLDIGCGWGSLLSRAVSQYQVKEAVGLTVSQAQAQWIQKQPTPGVAAILEGWQDHHPDRPYDAICSIGQMEHLVQSGIAPERKAVLYRTFFARCHEWLKPGGHFSIQCIAYGTSGPEDLHPLIKTEIYPDSDLPRLSELASAWAGLFEVQIIVNHAPHYSRTLREWLRLVKSRKQEAVALLGSDGVRRFQDYLRISMASFDSGACELIRINLRRAQPRLQAGAARSSFPFGESV